MSPLPFRAGIETALHGSGLPYGYTLTVFSSGQVLIHQHGSPGVVPVLLFAAGGAAAWALLRFLSRGASESSGLQLASDPHIVRAGAVHVMAIGGAIGAAALVALIDGTVAWPLGAFVATLLYLGTVGLELGMREREEGHP